MTRHHIETADLAQLLLCEADENRPGMPSVLTSNHVTRVKWRVFERLPSDPQRRAFHLHLAIDLAQDVLLDAVTSL